MLPNLTWSSFYKCVFFCKVLFLQIFAILEHSLLSTTFFTLYFSIFMWSEMLSLWNMFIDTIKSNCEKRLNVVVVAQLVRWRSKCLYVDRRKPNLGWKTVSQVQLPRGKVGMKKCSPRGIFYCPGYYVFFKCYRIKFEVLIVNVCFSAKF